jgi:ubiquinone/menaquinone biosynthesis C-methylase UbiE
MDQTKNHYSYRVYADPKMAQTFDQRRFGGSIGEYIKWVQEQAVFSQLTDVKGWKIADIGAGTGRLTIPLLEKGARVTACDASEHMLEVLKQKVQHPGLETRLVDAHKLPFEDRNFQCSLSFRMLMHVVDWEKSLAEICRISDDWVIIDLPAKRGLLLIVPAWHSIRRLFSPNYQSYRTLVPEQVFSKLNEYGFEIVTVDPGYFLPIAVYRVIHSKRLMEIAEKFFTLLKLPRHFGSPVTVFARRRR